MIGYYWILILFLNDEPISFHVTNEECKTELKKMVIKNPKKKYLCVPIDQN